MASAVAVQRAARVLIAYRRVSRRREAIAAIQAFYRGCRVRWSLSTVLENAQRVTLSPRDSGGAVPRNRLLVGCDGSAQVGMVTRRDVPMDADCPEGFGPPNLAAFLWESREQAYAPEFGAEDADTAATSPAPYSEGVDRRSCWKEHDGDVNGDENDGAVFELSAKAVNFTTFIGENGEKISGRAARVGHVLDERKGEPPDVNELAFSSVAPAKKQPLPSRWTPVAVAPPEALERALRCSTLVVSSPSFDSACARRLFSRLGRPPPRPSSLPRGQTTADHWQRTTPPAVSLKARSKRSLQNPQLQAKSAALAREEEETGQYRTSSLRLQGAGLRHILLVGESPIGNGGLLEISSAVRCHCLPRLTTLVIGGPGCRVEQRGVMALAVALSSPGCSQLRKLVSKEDVAGEYQC